MGDGVFIIEDVLLISFFLLLLVLLLLDDEQQHVLDAWRRQRRDVSASDAWNGDARVPLHARHDHRGDALSSFHPSTCLRDPLHCHLPNVTANHKVGASEDYKAPSATDSDTSVLLQYKEGSDYKLALNMQQYSPDDITIKLNGRTLTIEAAGHGEQFKQKHVIPDNIDLDAMSSSFSSDGVLVIKAPKMK